MQAGRQQVHSYCRLLRFNLAEEARKSNVRDEFFLWSTLAVSVCLLLSGLLLFAVAAFADYDPNQEEAYVAVILTEAAGETEEGQTAVCEVLRNRHWSVRGFAGLERPDLQRFLARQNVQAVPRAKRALLRARRGSNLAGSATHYENVESFGMPWWAKKMKRVAKVGQHTFFKVVVEK